MSGDPPYFNIEATHGPSGRLTGYAVIHMPSGSRAVSFSGRDDRSSVADKAAELHPT